jgi:ubiquitin-protein ligase
METVSRMLMRKELDGLSAPGNVLLEGRGVQGFEASVMVRSGPFQGQTVKFHVDIPVTYPIEGPRIFVRDSDSYTRHHHPSIDPKTGAVCLSILKLGWRPYYDLSLLINGLVYILEEPLECCTPCTTAERAEEPVILLNPQAYEELLNKQAESH